MPVVIGLMEQIGICAKNFSFALPPHPLRQLPNPRAIRLCENSCSPQR